jgi:hypothetical protein
MSPRCDNFMKMKHESLDGFSSISEVLNEMQLGLLGQ